ncbi:hypothetical protein EDD18DRAFT_1353614 [Armillaria luteobubalina]|uniref:Uncharacterized protein n=1 Tax=Armillaria luteobubalina TaxID=153913 RepID=A0AA39Q5H5_9AGAR|nr:hypothetical protein EDD18DRAFT_1353614 [Armillaria luteobubalina]
MFGYINKTPLPDLGSLSPPFELFTITAPYILTVSLPDSPGLPTLVVDCSHEPTLELLNTYLKCWADTHLTFVKSDFNPGTMDSLVIESSRSQAQRGGKANPAAILAFIEGVLGYKMVYTSGSFWMYRRTALFE